MKRFFPNNDNHERALILLSSFAPDSVDDILSLLSIEGRGSIEGKLRQLRDEDSGLPCINAMYSRDMIADFEDFFNVYVGMGAIGIYNLKTQHRGEKEYATILESVFNLPTAMAEQLGANIETYDTIHGTAEAEKDHWWVSITSNLGEILRRAANWTGSLIKLPWHIEESQSYDIDGLYEISMLGKAVLAMNSRMRLMGSQIKISSSLGLQWVSATTAGVAKSKGDLETGDVLADLALLFRPFVSNNVPDSVMGGLGKAARTGGGITATAARKIAQQNEEDGDIGGVGDISLNDTWMDHETGDVAIPTQLTLAAGNTPAVRRLVDLINQGRQAQATNEQMRSHVANAFGDAAASALENGDLEGFVGEIVDSASCDTTGDPALDAHIANQVMQQHIAEGGDPAEMGGLFMKLRTRHQMNKARRHQKKALKQATFDWAKDFANTDFNGQAQQFLQDQHANDPANVYEPDGSAGGNDGSMGGDDQPVGNMDIPGV